MMNSILLKLPQLSLVKSVLVALALICTAILALVITPTLHSLEQTPDFETIIPKQFGEWKEVVNPYAQVSLSTNPDTLVNQIYDSVLMRTYVNSRGDRVMLALAYAKEQRQDVKVHQPDVCYPAQGYQMLKSEIVQFDSVRARGQVVGKKQLYSGQNHLEAVSYWIRIGNETMTSGMQMRFKIIKDGLFKHQLDDGILVRVSSGVSDDSQLQNAYDLQDLFLAELVSAVEKTSAGLLVP